MNNLGNRLYNIVCDARNSLFEQGELAELSYGAFDLAARFVRDFEQEKLTIKYPIGLRADDTPMHSELTYGKDDLLNRYTHLASHQIAFNGLLHLVTIVEAMFGDVVRAVIMRYPRKLGSKRTIRLSEVIEACTIDEIHLRAADALIYDLAYKNPAEFAVALNELLSINLLECPAFHCYMEVKATRDIFIHNREIANEIYVRKAASHARVLAGQRLPADQGIFCDHMNFACNSASG